MSLVLSVAKELVKLSLAGDEQDPLTNLRLQKLLYYAQAWSLIIRESELFPEEIEAWRWGPVVPAVYRRLSDGQGANHVCTDQFAQAHDLAPEHAEFVRNVWEAYNPHSALELSRMTHKELPWLRAWGDRPADGTGSDPIRVEDMEEYFGKQAIPAPLADYCHELRRREEEAAEQLAAIPRMDVDLLAIPTRSYTTAARKLCASKG